MSGAHDKTIEIVLRILYFMINEESQVCFNLLRISSKYMKTHKLSAGSIVFTNVE